MDRVKVVIEDNEHRQEQSGDMVIAFVMKNEEEGEVSIATMAQGCGNALLMTREMGIALPTMIRKCFANGNEETKAKLYQELMKGFIQGMMEVKGIREDLEHCEVSELKEEEVLIDDGSEEETAMGLNEFLDILASAIKKGRKDK